MTSRRLRVGFVGWPAHPVFLEAAGADPALEVVRMPLDADPAEVLAFLQGCDGYYTMAARDDLPAAYHLGEELLAKLPNLLLAVSYGAGFDTVDVPACTRAGVGVVAQVGGNANGVAEHALGMMLTLFKRIPQAQAALRAGTLASREDFLGRELAGRTVGLIGLGHVGMRVARLLGAFGCPVLAFDPLLDEATCAGRGARKVDLPTLLAQSDVVSLHCPLNATTRGMIGAEAFAMMRPGALFVTTARGWIHDEAALLAALDSGHLAGAGLDVWEREPPRAGYALLDHPCVIASPHTAGVTEESRSRVARMAAEAFSALAAGEVPPRLVDPSVAETLMRRRAEILGG
ncbi:NAD(P)-dependent oxidoreductase [Geminicoccaceae bacterium 1502E]|nr:NAD(P)-dependent oxidoreductase [Geminicoccaceae bacterium 1502E]